MKEYEHDVMTNVGHSRRRWLAGAAVMTAMLEISAAIGLMVLMGSPGGAMADDLVVEPPSADAMMIEIPFLDERLQNGQSGLTHVYDVEIIMQTAACDAAHLKQALSRCGHEVRAALVHGWRSANPAHLDEPNLGTMKRRYEDLMLERFGDCP